MGSLGGATMEDSWCFVQFEAVVRAADVGARAGAQVELTANPKPTVVAQTVAKQTLTGGDTIKYLPTPATLKPSASMPIENPPLPTNGTGAPGGEIGWQRAATPRMARRRAPVMWSDRAIGRRIDPALAHLRRSTDIERVL